MSRPTNPLGPRYVALAEAAAYLGRTEKALRKLVERRAVPFRKAGKRLVFDVVELDRWVVSLPGVTLYEAVDRCLGQPLTSTHARRAHQRA